MIDCLQVSSPLRHASKEDLEMKLDQISLVVLLCSTLHPKIRSLLLDIFHSLSLTMLAKHSSKLIPFCQIALLMPMYRVYTHNIESSRLGRYPIHFHLNGDMTGSYVRGVALHQTFNRAINIHGSHNILVEHTVAYNVMGGAFFLEDGIETGNKYYVSYSSCR